MNELSREHQLKDIATREALRLTTRRKFNAPGLSDYNLLVLALAKITELESEITSLEGEIERMNE